MIRSRRLRGMLLFALGALMLLASARAEEARDVTGACRFAVSEGKAAKLCDGKIATAWTPARDGAEVRVALPEDGAGFLALEWDRNPTGYRLIQYDAAQNEIASCGEADKYIGISMLFPLEADARYLRLQLTQPGQGISEIRIGGRGELPEGVMNWEAPYEKCDLMVISTHQDDEWLWFAGIIPYYQCVQNRKVQVVYMADCGRSRYDEALRGLWVGGVRHYPELIGLKDERIASYEKTVQHWGGYDEVLRILVSRIRRYKPEVILTHDWDGEYGHNQHKVTSRAMEYAIEAAADPSRYPDSYALYGAWQVKKLYRHLETRGQIRFDWSVPYAELGGRTPLEVARAAYAQHASQQKYFQVKENDQYDNRLFGLSYSAVGEDQLHEDLFENLAEAAPDEQAVGEAPGAGEDAGTAAVPAQEGPAEGSAAQIDSGANTPDGQVASEVPGARGDVEAAAVPAQAGSAEGSAAQGDSGANIPDGQVAGEVPGARGDAETAAVPAQEGPTEGSAAQMDSGAITPDGQAAGKVSGARGEFALATDAPVDQFVEAPVAPRVRRAKRGAIVVGAVAVAAAAGLIFLSHWSGKRRRRRRRRHRR